MLYAELLAGMLLCFLAGFAEEKGFSWVFCAIIFLFGVALIVHFCLKFFPIIL